MLCLGLIRQRWAHFKLTFVLIQSVFRKLLGHSYAVLKPRLSHGHGLCFLVSSAIIHKQSLE